MKNLPFRAIAPASVVGIPIISVFLGLLLFPSYGYSAEGVSVWPVNIHHKIFPDSRPGDSVPLTLRAARNEYESGQFGVFSSTDCAGLRLEASELRHDEDQSITISSEQIRLRPVGLIHVTKNTPGAENIVVREAPCDIPDVLYESDAISLKGGESQGVWVTVKIPEDAKSGSYSGTITLKNDAASVSLPMKVEVFNFTLPSDRHLWVTNWFTTWNFAKVHQVDEWSEEHWEVLERYFKNLSEHRQNVIYTNWAPDGRYVKAVRKADGTWEIDFSNLDRYLKLAEKYGLADRVELLHCGHIDRQRHEVAWRTVRVFDEKAGKNIDVNVNEWLEPVLGKLESWLRATGRLERSMIHVADEPFREDMSSWRAASQRIHAAAPELKRIDAIETLNFTDCLEVWVPKLSHYDRWRTGFDQRRRENEEMWYYICCHPVGEKYPNRFMDIPATRVRSLHWLNFTEELDGYLHWGLNFWGADPFGPPTEQYGPGDTHAIYPGPLDSIRWEIERESLEDFEYFVLYQRLQEEAKSAGKADLWWLDPRARSLEFARRAVHSISEIEQDPASFEDARLELAREIESFVNGPRLLVQSFPENGSVSLRGPIVIEVYGLTTPGAKATVDGRPVEVAEDGTFGYSMFLNKTVTLEFTAELDGKKTTTRRTFLVE